MNGTLFGVGVGPGDPELMTLKAVRLIKQCDVIAIIQANGENQTAFHIAKQAVPELEQKQKLVLDTPMTCDLEEAQRNRNRAAQQLMEVLNTGKNIAFLTLGDPTVYSTYLYLHQRVEDAGFQTSIVSGVPSFCAVAAALGTSLAEGKEPLTIIPGSYACTKEMLQTPGNKVLMKTGRSFEPLKEMLSELNLIEKTQMVEQCGMKDEKIYRSLQDISEDPHYFSIFLVKP